MKTAIVGALAMVITFNGSAQDATIAAIKARGKASTSQAIYEACLGKFTQADIYLALHQLFKAGDVERLGVMGTFRYRLPGMPDCEEIKVPQEKTRKPIARTGAGLRDALFAQLEALQAGEIDAAEAKAFASVAHAIIKTVEVQLSYEQQRKRGELISDATDVLTVGGDGNEGRKALATSGGEG